MLRKFVLLFFLIPLLFSCGANPFDGKTINAPQMPDSLAASSITRSLSLSASRILGYTDPLGIEYGHFGIVPQIAYNYNNWINSSVDDLINTAIEFNEWTEINTSPFTKEYLYGGTDTILRVNDDYSEYEFYYTIPTENRYLRVKESDGIKHGILIIEFPQDNQKDCIEIIETENNLYSKGVRIQKYTTTPFLAHFCGITDKTTTNQNTTGRLMAEGFDAVPSIWGFSNEPGTVIDTDYLSQENHPFQGTVVSSYDGTYDVYGFFDDANYYNDTGTITHADDGYPDPDSIRPMFENGLNHAVIMEVDLSTNFGQGGIEIPTWTEGIIE